MIISVLGNLIDTRSISNITKVEPVKMGMGYFTKDGKLKSVFKGFGFTINQFNGVESYIEIDYDILSSKFNRTNWYDPNNIKDYETNLKILEESINEVYNTVIDYWNKDKTDIPLIDFKIN